MGRTANPAVSVTADRAARLARMLALIAKAAKSRDTLLTKLRIDRRGFYRDLKLLRDRGVDIAVDEDMYRLHGDLSEAQSRLPFPDPALSFAEVEVLARGKTEAHRKLKSLLAAVLHAK